MHDSQPILKSSKQDIRITTTYNQPSKPIKPRELTPAEHKRLIRLANEEKKIHFIHDGLALQEKVFLQRTSKGIDILEQSTHLKTKLMDYQLYGVSWMVDREISLIHGGILADEMGLGKTLQALGLILNGCRTELNLVVVPAIALSQWVTEIELHAPGAFNVHVYYGRDRVKEFTMHKTKFNIILTTYGLVTSECKRKKGLLFTLKYYRIILDEAHVIKSQGTGINAAITKLSATVRWGMTGTPVQNRVSDLYSLIRFLRLDPHSFYFCKRCPCKSFRWLNYDKQLWKDEDEIKRMTDPNEIDKRINMTGSKTCEVLPTESCPEFTPVDVNNQRVGFCVCGHFSTSHFSWWNRRIVSRVREFGFTVKSVEVFKDLSQITSHIILRRTKDLLENQLGLPSKKINVLRNYFTPQEKDFYTNLYKDTKTKFDSYVQHGQVISSYAHIFDLLNKMRQAANHPYLALKDYNSDVPICGYCNDEADDPIVSACKHIFCREEARAFLLTESKCPVCKVKITIDLNQEFNFTFKNRVIHTSNWTSSSKIESLIEQLSLLKTETENPKTLVFSQFVNFLELLRWRLERAGFKCVKIYGSTPIIQRKAAIDLFNTDKTITVFLISLKAGGLALNLTEANRVFLMDLWWNPAVENQAIDRIHRIGQYRPIRVTKIIVEDSIESRVLVLQQKKQALFESAVDNDIAALEKLTEDDLLFLFS